MLQFNLKEEEAGKAGGAGEVCVCVCVWGGGRGGGGGGEIKSCCYGNSVDNLNISTDRKTKLPSFDNLPQQIASQIIINQLIKICSFSSYILKLI